MWWPFAAFSLFLICDAASGSDPPPVLMGMWNPATGSFVYALVPYGSEPPSWFPTHCDGCVAVAQKNRKSNQRTQPSVDADPPPMPSILKIPPGGAVTPQNYLRRPPSPTTSSEPATQNQQQEQQQQQQQQMPPSAPTSTQPEQKQPAEQPHVAAPPQPQHEEQDTADVPLEEEGLVHYDEDNWGDGLEAVSDGPTSPLDGDKHSPLVPSTEPHLPVAPLALENTTGIAGSPPIRMPQGIGRDPAVTPSIPIPPPRSFSVSDPPLPIDEMREPPRPDPFPSLAPGAQQAQPASGTSPRRVIQRTLDPEDIPPPIPDLETLRHPVTSHPTSGDSLPSEAESRDGVEQPPQDVSPAGSPADPQQRTAASTRGRGGTRVGGRQYRSPMRRLRPE
ncbi:hypothetical protein PAPYR_1587 [Paratrimastix pyriformis]|uniref:Uncharacterized protein n=1 Tax=Paratrimastix pyriformis TaxID=342808 RepID=A0ABQ8URX9_9EUKA|nr:hypothetical protein PAPYR_1587 [Paratrimastix pyriformis]